MSANHKIALSIADVSWASFVNMLEYKAEWYGNNVIKIGRFEASSQICSCCGHQHTNLKGLKNLSIREWHCTSCNAYHDRDINSAINIKNFGLIAAHKATIREDDQPGSERPIEPAEMLTSICAEKRKQVGSMTQETHDFSRE